MRVDLRGLFSLERARRGACCAFWALLVALVAASARPGSAANLVLYNAGMDPIRCANMGPQPQAGDVPISPGGRVAIPAGASGIDSLDCGALALRHLDVRAGADVAHDRIVVLNGRQQRALRVALFPYLPSSPAGDLSTLTRALEERFTQRFPDVALQLVMSPDVDPYDFGAFASIFGRDGYDVVEIDTSVLSTLVSSGYVVAVAPTGDAPMPFAATAVAAPNSKVWALPTWICRDFLFGRDSSLRAVRSIDSLSAYWANLRTPRKLVADFDGKFQLYAMYLNAYVARHGYGPAQVQAALSEAVDPAVIGDLVTVAGGCAPSGAANPCIDGTFHNGDDGAMEKNFADGTAAGDMGYSERSFYFEVGNGPRDVAVVPMPYGPSPVNLMYVDGLAQNAVRCSASPCASDAASFAGFLNSSETRAFIAFADDLRTADRSVPPRHLLPAAAAFYRLPRVLADPVYAAIIPVLATARPMPTVISQQTLKDLDGRICAGLKTRLPTYACTAPTSQGTSQ